MSRIEAICDVGSSKRTAASPNRSGDHQSAVPFPVFGSLASRDRLPATATTVFRPHFEAKDGAWQGKHPQACLKSTQRVSTRTHLATTIGPGQTNAGTNDHLDVHPKRYHEEAPSAASRGNNQTEITIKKKKRKTKHQGHEKTPTRRRKERKNKKKGGGRKTHGEGRKLSADKSHQEDIFHPRHTVDTNKLINKYIHE